MTAAAAIAASPAADRAEDRLFGRITWRLMPILFVCYVISYVDRVNIGFAKLQMLDDLHFSAAVYGLGAGVFFVGFVLAEVPSNLLLYRFGARLWLAGLMAVWGALSMLMLTVRTVEGFYILRFLLGVAEAGFVPGAALYLTRWYPPHRQGRVFALLIMGAPAGGVLVGPLSGWIMGAFQHAGGLRNWQWLFLLQGAPAVLMGGALLALLPETPLKAAWLSASEKADVAERLAEPARHTLRRSDVLAALASGRTWVLGLAQFTTNLGIYAGVFWLPSTIKAAGVSGYGAIGLLSTLPYLAAAVAMWGLGRSSDLARERRWHCFGAMLVAALGLALQALFGASTLGILGLVLSISFFIAVTPLVWAQAGEFISGPAAATGFAMVNIFAGSAGFFASYAMGTAQQTLGSTADVSAVMAVIAVGGALLFLRVRSGLREATA